VGATGASATATAGVPLAPGLPVGSIPGYFTAKDPLPASIDTKGIPATDWSSTLWAEALIAQINDTRPKGTPMVANSLTNVENIERWISAETAGQSGGFLRDNNPLNLNTYGTGRPASESLPNGTLVTEFGVNIQKFNTIQDGINATAAQLLDPSSSKLLAALQISAPASNFGTALGTTGWGMTKYANATVFPTLTPAIVYGSGDTVAQNNASATGGANPGEAFPGQDQLAKIPGVSTIGGLIGDITNPTTLKNVGIFVAGAALVITGLLIFFAQTKTAQGVASTTEKVA
jgi:hypothetical protein